MIDDGPVYHAQSVQLSRDKSVTCFNDRCAATKFSESGVLDRVLEGSTRIFGDTQIFLTQCSKMGGKKTARFVQLY